MKTPWNLKQIIENSQTALNDPEQQLGLGGKSESPLYVFWQGSGVLLYETLHQTGKLWTSIKMNQRLIVDGNTLASSSVDFL